MNTSTTNCRNSHGPTRSFRSPPGMASWLRSIADRALRRHTPARGVIAAALAVMFCLVMAATASAGTCNPVSNLCYADNFTFCVGDIMCPAATTPSAPTITGITAGNGQLSVAFTAGADGGLAIIDYKYSTNGGSTFTSTGTTASPIVITGLTNGTTYQVQIKAVNYVGDGSATASSSATPGNTPSAPTITGITAGNWQLSVAFTAGANGGSAITNYKYSTDGGTSFTAVSPAATTSPIVIAGLTNGTSYSVQIKAVNSVGDGAATASSGATPATSPSAPTITGITAGNGQLSVAFTAGANGGSALTNYKYSTDNGSTFTAVSPAATTSPIVITGLTNGTTYQVQIKAVNAMGDGTATASSGATPVNPTPAAITYDANGATSGSVPTDVGSPYTSGSTVTVKGNTGGLTKTGYVFVGWNTAASGGSGGYGAGDSFAISADTTLYAQWIPVMSDWSKNFSTASSNTYILATVTDNSGNLYVTGYFTSPTLTMGSTTLTSVGVFDAFAAKLDSRGTVTWAKNFGGTDAYVSGSAISVDGAGNVYLGGYFNTADLTTPALTMIGVQDALALKLDSTGAVVWAHNYGGGGASANGNGIAVDGLGNVYLGGYFNAANLTTPALTKIGDFDAFALKLDSSGATTWARNFGGSGAGAYGNGIAVDGSGNVYLGGYFDTANLTTPVLTKIGTTDAFALKLDSSGTTTWARNFGGSGANAHSQGVAVDGSGNVYLGGFFNSAALTTPSLTKIGSEDVFAFKLNSSGSVTWAKNFGGSGANAYCYGIAVDDSDNVYLGGEFGGANLTTPALTRIGSQDAYAIRLDSTGSLTGATNFGGSGAFARSMGVAVDGADNVYLGGAFSGASLTTPALTKIGTTDAFILRNTFISTPTLSVTTSPATYDGTVKSATVTGSVAGTVSNVKYGGSATAPTNAGTYAITADFTPTDTINYTSLTAASAGNFVINKATPTASVTNGPVIYDGTAKSATVTCLGGGTAGNILTGGAASQTSAGTYAVTADCAASANYNAATGISAGNFVISSKLSQTIAFGTAPTVVIGGTGTMSATATSGLGVTFSSTTPSVCTMSGATVSAVTAGTCTIAADQTGNANYNPATRVTQNITVIALSLTVSALPDGAVTTETTQNISGKVSDTAILASLTINGATITTVSDGSFSYPVQLVAGANTITVIAVGTTGDTITNTRTITLDTTAPKLTVTYPPDNKVLIQNHVTVTGTIADLFESGTATKAVAKSVAATAAGMTVNCSVNGSSPQAASLTDTTYSCVANLDRGMNTILISAMNSANKSVQAKRTASYMPAFSLAVTDPAADIRTVQSSYLLTGSVADNTTPVSVTVAMDGQGLSTVLIPVNGGSFQQQLTLGDARVYQVSVTGTDQNSNTLTVQRNVIRTVPKAVDGDAAPFTIMDALTSLKMAIGLIAPDTSQVLRMDVAPMVNGVSVGDGKVDIEDTIVILRMSVGLL